jgi:multicomponent Na+:H+ antiporter subunit C
VSLLPYLVAAFIFLFGVAGVVTSRNLIHVVVSLGVAQSSTYVLLLAVGYRSGGTAPVFSDVPPGRRAVDPVVQALTLTDVVVSVAVAALLLSLAVEIEKRTGTLDPNELHTLHG